MMHAVSDLHAIVSHELALPGPEYADECGRGTVRCQFGGSQRVELRLNIAQESTRKNCGRFHFGGRLVSSGDKLQLPGNEIGAPEAHASRLPRYVRHAGFYHRLLHHRW